MVSISNHEGWQIQVNGFIKFMKQLFLVTVLATFIMLVFETISSVPVQAAVLVESAFNIDTENWKIVSTKPGGIDPTQREPQYCNKSGTPDCPISGNPDGYIRKTDPDSFDWLYEAPPKFLGNFFAAYGGILSFDLKLDVHEGKAFEAAQLSGKVKGQKITLISESALVKNTTDWISYSIPLLESAWVKQGSNKPVSAEEMKEVLSSLEQLLIRGEASISSDAANLDNVRIISNPVNCP